MASPRRAQPIPILLTLLAAALQFSALAAQSLWYDEGFSVWLARQSPRAIIDITAADIQPPLYYLLLSVWIRLTGQSEYALRFLSALCAVLCVPLMCQLARRLLRAPFAATIAALLVAISPLWLWYGREVRNYALLLALLLAAAYAMLGLLRGDRVRAPWVIALLLTAGLYTHYFMLFVGASWMLVALLYAIGNLRERLRPVAIAFGFPLLLYVPWLGTMLTRLGADRSYWEGQLNLTDALLKTLASWVAGHTLVESSAIQLGIAGLLLALLGLILPFLRVDRIGEDHLIPSQVTPYARLLLAAWLFIPVVGYLAVAFDRPKFNARYLIFSAPAFWLAVVLLLSWLWRKDRLLGVIALAAVLLSQVEPTFNLYTDPAFAKADWRDVARYIEAHRQPGEEVILVSGHAFPMTEYYLPGVDVLRLPEARTLDTSQVLGLNVARPLASTLRHAGGAWLINWQDEVADPEGVVPAYLGEQGGRRQETPLFQEVRLSHWRFPPGTTFEDRFGPQYVLDTRFENTLTLRGWSAPDAPAPVDGGIPLQLFWSAARVLDGDYWMHARVVDEEGFQYTEVNQRPTAFNLPTFRWQPGELRLANLNIPMPVGTQPGNYFIEVSLYETGQEGDLDILDAAGAPQGQWARLGPIPLVAPANGWQDGQYPRSTYVVNQPLLGDWRVTQLYPIPAELSPIPDSQTNRTGERFSIVVWLEADPDRPVTELALLWHRGEERHEMEPRALVNHGWKEGEPVLVPLWVRAPTSPGTWTLSLQATDAGGNQATADLAPYTITATDHNFEAPDPSVPQEAAFDSSIRLLGYDLERRDDNTVNVTLHWESLAPVEKSYATFVHLLDANGVIIPDGGQDKLPLDGARPTDGWVEGEYLSDTFTLKLPSGGHVQPYLMEVGWYDAQDPGFPRLPATGTGADGNRVLLSERLP